ncbi:putative serine/threonine-protein kinase [Asparagus officinalis]|uniref:putative serine/threonine-protein kinase n=1 Tax=Asparagus officinalis TaxID=4686 RepID=UPI00098E1114|nr:putative serine/threonine-protein kinase [Asparagus officinalis]XP_020274922.1 putative serine/threonine-protein kinase [Asparagus officinalis]XP_020274923.1 putative serine/threonine-protein kinase [Asparagus officinalis]
MESASKLYRAMFSETHFDMSWCCFGARKKPQQELGGCSQNIRLFSYNELLSATGNFLPSNRIGRGGFGTVYKGTLRNGMLIAAKVLSAQSRQGINEFLTEIDVITNVKHPNLVELLGCCVQESNRILVYEYAENNSLDHALLGPRSRPADLNWEIRSEICLGTAKGLAYLHEGVAPHIVHRDIKASNVLLDKNFVPKIGDFGLAKLFPDNVTHISTRVAGTSGYLAPEYAARGQLTRKADVYSFGVLVLEIISGRSSSRSWSEMEKYLLERTWELYEEERLLELMDPELKEYPEEQVIRYIKVGLFCTQGAAVRRPSMPQVVQMLSKPIRLNEKELTPPGLLEDWRKTGEGFRLKKLDPDNKDSSTMNTTSPLTSTPVTFSEMGPR